MKEARGNLWTMPADLRCITTNGFVKATGHLVMGRGCAMEARDMYPGLDLQLGALVRKHGNHVHYLALDLQTRLASFPVKHNWWEKADITLIERSAHELVRLVDSIGYHNVVIPRPGCGNGGLHWDHVRAVIAPILDDRFTVITY